MYLLISILDFSLARQGYEVYQELYHNNYYVFTIYGLGNQAFCDDGNSAILHLKAGDQITVKAHRDNYLYGSETQIYSSLTAVRLWNEEEMYSGG